MKLSLNWIFEHINAKREDYDVNDLVEKINLTTAEIEDFKKINIDWKSFSIAKIEEKEFKKGSKEVVLKSFEWKKVIKLRLRMDLYREVAYLIKRESKGYRWATLNDLGASKEGFVPPLSIKENELKGGWKDQLENEDYILELDNKSLTNRPDLWGHRGFAREVAAIIKKSLIDEESILASKPVRNFARKIDSKVDYLIDISNSKVCNRFAGIEISQVSHIPSLLWMVNRLSKVDTRAIDFFVDLTNYVMWDLGHPMHAFDVDKFSKKSIIVREAKKGEKLKLLDDETVKLTSEDCVITDGKKVLSVAGIMGGAESAISRKTKKIFLEAAHFGATAIRRSSARIKKRSESSLRFEKWLDPNQNVNAILRFLKLLDDSEVKYSSQGAILSVGLLEKEKTIKIAHQKILDCIGTSITPKEVQEILSNLGFGIEVEDEKSGISYKITVPTYRGSKDVTIKEDIIEEVARFFGYSNIPLRFPSRAMVPFENLLSVRRRAIKNHCSYAMDMREVSNYALYDETFLKKISFKPEKSPILQNPLSENWQRTVTSLAPHLIKNVLENCSNESKLRFFELNKIWKGSGKKNLKEQNSLAGVFFEQDAELNFYDCKMELQSLFDSLRLEIEWKNFDASFFPWLDQFKSAELFVGKEQIGYAGYASEKFLSGIFKGSLFLFELNADFLLNYEAKTPSFKVLPKYQAVSLDISMFVPAKVTVEELEKALVKSDPRVEEVFLIDIFEKKEWGDLRSVTIRSIMRDRKKTLTGNEIEKIQEALQKVVLELGVKLR